MTAYTFEHAMKMLKQAIEFGEAEGDYSRVRVWVHYVEESHHAEFASADEGQARLCNAVVADVSPRLNLLLDVCGDIDTQNGALLPIEGSGADVQDAVRWQDEAIAQEADVKDWQDQVTELRGG